MAFTRKIVNDSAMARSITQRMLGGPAVFAFALAASGCGRSTPAPAPQQAPSSLAPMASASRASAVALPFIEDDYPRALREARRTGRAIFVDVWAPWCHTCLSLKQYVLTDPSLAPHAARFVWLSIDSERPENAAPVERLRITALPTLTIVEPARETEAWTWRGALTAKELVGSLSMVQERLRNPGSQTDLEAAELAARSGREGEALDAYKRALAAATDEARGPVADAFVTLLDSQKRFADCAAVAAQVGPSLPEGTYRVDLAITGAHCAIEATAGKDKSGAAARDAAAPFIRELRLLSGGTSSAVLADDRSSAFEALVSTLRATGDAEGAKAAAREWALMLESAAGRAKTPAERVVFDAHRLGAYIELGEPARALPMLEASERDFPDDYNPSARRARALLELGRLDDATKAAERALERAYGPRRLRLFILKADISKKRGDRTGEGASLDDALADAKRLSLRDSYRKLVESIEARRKALP